LRTMNPAASVPATVMAGQTLDPAEALLPDSAVVGKRRLQVVYGKELYYVEGEAALMAISVSTEGAFTLGLPQHLFESSDLLQPGGVSPTYDVSADGE